jgi:hypothetical protein
LDPGGPSRTKAAQGGGRDYPLHVRHHSTPEREERNPETGDITTRLCQSLIRHDLRRRIFHRPGDLRTSNRPTVLEVNDHDAICDRVPHQNFRLDVTVDDLIRMDAGKRDRDLLKDLFEHGGRNLRATSAQQIFTLNAIRHIQAQVSRSISVEWNVDKRRCADPQCEIPFRIDQQFLCEFDEYPLVRSVAIMREAFVRSRHTDIAIANDFG